MPLPGCRRFADSAAFAMPLPPLLLITLLVFIFFMPGCHCRWRFDFLMLLLICRFLFLASLFAPRLPLPLIFYAMLPPAAATLVAITLPCLLQFSPRHASAA